MFAFKKKQRLLKKTEYDFVFQKAKKIHMDDYIVLFRKTNLGYARLGLALSKKIISKSHDRNHVKRLIREGFRKAQLPSVDLIFLARKGMELQINSVLNNKLSNTWEQLKSYYDK